MEDSRVLLAAGRYDGAVYTCGYVIELGLKARICETLKWEGYPRTGGEFSDYRSFKTHDLKVLLSLSGIEEKINETLLLEWSAVNLWSPESRYDPIGNVSREAAEKILKAVKVLFESL